jgi:tryptophan-rich sensory protein
MINYYKPVKKYLAALIVVLVALIIYLCAMVFTEDNYEWFLDLNKPSYQPEAWVFMVVWAILFALIAASAIIILFSNKKNRKKCNFVIMLFIINALLNAFFNLAMFGMHNILFAVIILPLYLASIFVLIFCCAKVNKIAAYLLVPYALWSIYATILMVSFLFIN